MPKTSGNIDIGSSSKTWGAIYGATFHGDGANLDNTGAEITNATGTSQQVVLTTVTSGTMTTAHIDSALTYNPTSDTLNVGALIATGDITAFSSSDRNLKDNITPIPNALTKINSISGNTFNWNEKSDYEGKADTGVIAQEIEALGLPGVTTTRDDGTKAVRYEKLVPVLIEAIKELSAKVDALS